MLKKKLFDEIAIHVNSLNEEQRRDLYSKILSAIRASERGELESFCDAMVGLNGDACKKVLDLVELGMDEFGKPFVWQLYTVICTGEIAESLGQHFTSDSVVDLALSALEKNSKRILDPMAGHGAFLVKVSEKFEDATITGVDIDGLPLEAAHLVLDDRVKTYPRDVFRWALENSENEDIHFDAVVGNPAYISYQKLQKMGDFANFKKNYRKYILGTLKRIAKDKGMALKLNKLFQDWSGYSDLSAYALVLSWLLLDDGGKIVFVTTNHWLERRYGTPIKEFLAANGTVNGVVTRRNGSWFPNLQIPTNIFVYTKEKPSKLQEKRGIPYVEFHVDDIKKTIASIESDNKMSFWKWLGALEKPVKNKEIHVNFKKWTSKKQVALRASEGYNSDNVELPENLGNHELTSFESIGWAVHQGLRTGCNEVFYLSSSDKRNEYISTFTRGGKKSSEKFYLASDMIVPTIQKTSSRNPLTLKLEDVDTYLLHFKNTLLPEDMKRINSTYPILWKKKWKIDTYREMPSEIAKHIRDCQFIPYEGKGPKKTPPSELSAVKTNAFFPSLEAKKIPDPPRFWYQIKLQPRHFGKIIIPRVSGGLVRSYLVKGKNQILTDANFVTLVPSKEKIKAKHLWVWLNSNMFRLMAEINGITMGGGALKLETTIIKKLPVPLQLLKSKSGELDNIAITLERGFSEQELIGKGEEIDSVLFDKTVAEQVKKNLKECLESRKR